MVHLLDKDIERVLFSEEDLSRRDFQIERKINLY